MKKYFKFAVVAAAGMLASCSSESLTGSDPEIKTPAQEELVPIEIGVATNQTKAVTRSTGTVGGIDGGTNIWKGEKVNVLMYKINSDGTPTFEYAKDGNDDNLYDNSTSLVTPLKDEGKASGLAKVINAGNPYTATAAGQASYKVKYYPATGRYDFWGYYLGGLGVSPAADPGEATDLGDANPTVDGGTGTTPAKIVNFVLDGAKDVMFAKAATGTTTAAVATDIVGNVPFTDNQNTAVEAIATAAGDEAAQAASRKKAYSSSYSAKAARAGLQPELVFKHALTRLTFKVQAGNDNAIGVKVTAIKVYSVKNGALIAAYDYSRGNISDANRIIWSESFNPTTDITTDSDEDGLYNYQDPDLYTAFSLQERNATTGAMQALTECELTATEVTTPKAIGEALLVAPQKKYWVEVEYDAEAAPAADWINDTPVGAAASTTPTPIKADIVRTDPANAFEAGKSYNVLITLYGPEKIEIKTTLEAWTNVDEDISVIGE